MSLIPVLLALILPILYSCAFFCHYTILLSLIKPWFISSRNVTGSFVIMSQQLRRHETLPDLSTQDDLGVPDCLHDGLGLPSHPTDIADPRIFMLSEVIKQTLSSSFSGLQSTLTDISTQMGTILYHICSQCPCTSYSFLFRCFISGIELR